MSKYGGNNRIDFGVHFNTDKSSLAEVQKAFQKLQDIKPANFKGTTEELRQIKMEALKVQAALTSAFNVKLGSLNVEKFKNELKGLNIDKIYTDLSRLGSQGQVAFSKMATSMMTTNLQLRETHSLINSMGTTMMNTVKWGIASSVMNNFTQSVSEAFQYVKSLDSALTDIRIVTGDSTEKMAEFADQANRAAQELGRSTMDYTKAALTFYQQGLSDEDVATRTEATLKAQNITGAGEQMADYLTAVWNGYKVANEEAELYVDKLAAVADSSASNMAQLATAMSKVASSANLLGVPVDSLNAQIATIIATTREAPESVGNSLKTIYARINDITTGADDAEVSLGNYSQQMAKVGISVLDTNGRLRDTQDVIEEVGEKWSSLSKEQQVYLARTMAGQRQYSRLLALFDNWGKYTDLVNISMDSQGTLMEKNSRYMDSLAAHMEKLGAAGERVKSAMIDSNSFKGLIDVGTVLTNLFANLIESIGGGGNALLMLGGALTSLFSGVIGKEINNIIVNLQTVRNNAALIQADIEQTRKLAESEGYSKGTIQEIVNAKTALTAIYSSLTQEQRSSYNQALMNIGAAKEELIQLEAKKNAAIEYQEAFKNVGIDIKTDDFQKSLAVINGEIEQLNESMKKTSRAEIFQSLDSDAIKAKNHIEEIQTSVENLKARFTDSNGKTFFATKEFDDVTDKFKNLDLESNNAKQQVIELQDAIDKLYAQLNYSNSAAINIDDTTAAYQRQKQALQDAIAEAERLQQTLSQGAGVQTAVNAFGQLGRIIASFTSAVTGLKNIWSFIKDPSAEGSVKKLTQGFTGLAMAIPMITLGMGKLKLETLELSRQFVNHNAIVAQTKIAQEAQLALEKAHAASLEAEKNGYVILDGVIYSKAAANDLQAGAAMRAKIANDQLNISLNANPIMKWITAITIAVAGIVALVKAIDAATMSSKEAEQAIDKFNEKQKEFHNSTKAYAEHTSSLKEMKNQYEALAQKAGAFSGDNNLDALTQAERQRYNEIKNTIAQYNDQAIAGYNERGQVILKNNNALKETIEILKELHKEETKQFFASTEYEDYKKAKQKELDDAKNKKTQAETKQKNGGIPEVAGSDVYDTTKAQIGYGFDDLSGYTKEQQKQLKVIEDKINEIFKDGKQNLYKHKKELSSLRKELENILTEEDYDYLGKAVKGLTDIAGAKKEADIEVALAEEEIAKKEKFDSNIIIDGLTLDNKYENLAQQYGQANINSLIDNYVSGLKRGGKGTKDEDDVIEKVKKDFIQPLIEKGFTSKDFEQIQNDISNVFNLEDFSRLNSNEYKTKTKEAIQKVLDNNEKLRALAKDPKTKGAFEAIIKSQFGLDEFSIDKNGKIDKITNDAIKAADQARTKFDTALKNNGIDWNDNQKRTINKWISEQDVQTLSNFDSILGKVNWDTKALAEEGKTLADEFQRAKNEVNEMATSEALTGASQLLQKQASGESLDKEEQEKLSGYLSQLQKLIPQYRSTIQVLQREWLQGTKFYQRSIEEVVNATFEMIEKQKEARMLMQEAAGVEVDSGPTEIESSKALSLIQNTENLQNAQNKNLLLTKDYQQALGTLASKYDTCTEELSRWVQAIASGNEQTIASAEHTLLLSTRAAELAEKSGLSADQIERTAAWLAESDSKLQENAELAADAAERYLRLNNALDEIYESGDKYKELLNELNTSGKDAIYANEELFKSFSEFKEQIADLFDGDVEFISDKWVTDNMQKIIDAVNSGSEQALDELNQSLASDMLLNLKVKINEEEWGMSKDQFLQDLYDLEDGTDLKINLDLLLWTQQLVTAMQEAGYAQDQIETALKEMGITVDLAPYEEGLNEAIDKSALAGKLASNAFAENAGNDATVVSQAKTQESEDLLGGTDYQVGQVRGWYTYPVINYGEGLFGPEVESVGQRSQEVLYPSYTPIPKNDTVKKSTSTVAQALQVVGATKSSGGKIANYNKPAQRSARKARTGSGGGKKGSGGGGGKSFTPTKLKNTKIESKQKTQQNDPYYKINKSIDKQSSLLKKLQTQEKNLSGKDRLENLNAQVQALKDQNELLEERQRISNNIAEENSTANLRKRLKDAFGSDIAFDSDGKIIDKNTVQKAAVDTYNQIESAANAAYTEEEKAWNKWVSTVYDLNQEKYKAEKEAKDEKLKNAEEERKETIKLAEDEYKKKTDLIKAYQEALEKDLKNYETYMETVRSIMQKTFEQRKIKIQFTLDSGELNREYQDFENKVIRKIKDSDIVGNAAAQFRELSSYIQSKELQSVSDEIKAISDDIARVNAGAWTQLMGISQTDYEMLKPKDQQLVRKEALGMLEEQLKELVKQEQDALSAIQDLTDEIAESYLDSIDAAKDALDEHIDQYNRINDLIEHNVKLTELLYGDKGYDTLNKYYDLQKQNNMNTLQTLKQQEDIYRNKLQTTEVGSEAWKKYKEILDDIIDTANSKIEDMLDNLTTQFEKKLAAAVERVNNKLTGGLGTSYLDEQWDYLNNYDDYFLDTYNATTGIEDVTRAYQQALDDAAANPKQQQRLNKLMNDQLKILREKDHLTEYDLERAKSMLEVEKARMALEDARNNKTKMRLRRDSQGNYTYQYVADEEKLSDLQDALSKAQNDLYNMDKEHYKETLNSYYDTYKEFTEKIIQLDKEQAQARNYALHTGDTAWLNSVNERIKLAEDYYLPMLDNLTEDNRYNQMYVTQSYSNGLGLDFTGLTDQQTWDIIKNNVPWATSSIQPLIDNVEDLGGALAALNPLIKNCSQATQEFNEEQENILNTGGILGQTIGQVIDEQGNILDTNIIEANSQIIMGYLNEITQKALTDVNTMQQYTKQLDEYWQTLNKNIQEYINNTREGYNTLQESLDSSTRAEVLDYTVPQINTTSTKGLAQAKEQLSLENISGEDIKALYNSYLSYLQTNKMFTETMSEHPELYDRLSQQQKEFNEFSERIYTDLVQDMIQQISNISIDSQIDEMTAGTRNLLSNLIKNQSLLDQNVHIDANFPNVNNHTQIEEAFNNLVNMAAMRASGYRD